MDVLGELIVRPNLDDEGDRGRARPSSSRRSAPTWTTPPSTPRSCSSTALFGDGPLGREICGDEPGIRALPEATIRDFWATTYRPANTVIAVAGDIGHDEARRARGRAFGTGNGAMPGFDPAPALPAGERVLGRQARHRAGPARASGVPALRRDHPDSWALAVLNAILGDGMSSRLFLSVREERGLAYDVGSGLVDYADAGALEVSAGVDPARPARGPRGDPRRAGAAARRAGPGRRAREGQAVPVRRPRAADGRDAPRRVVDRRPGGAPRPRPDARGGARRDRGASTPTTSQRVAGDLFRDDGLRLAAVAPARYLRGLERHLRLPA